MARPWWAACPLKDVHSHSRVREPAVHHPLASACCSLVLLESPSALLTAGSPCPSPAPAESPRGGWAGGSPAQVTLRQRRCHTTPGQSSAVLVLGPGNRAGISSVPAEIICPSYLYLQTCPIMKIFWFVADRSPEIIIWKWKKMLRVKALETCIVSLAANWNILDQMYPMYNLFKL